MCYLHAGKEQDRPFWRALPLFVSETVGGTYSTWIQQDSDVELRLHTDTQLLIGLNMVICIGI